MPERAFPEPTAEDEDLALEVMQLANRTNLRGRPDGKQRCGTCHFRQDPDQAISYCWHAELGIMVAGSWVCDRWTPPGTTEDATTRAQQRTASTLHAATVEAQHWEDQPRGDEKCSTCLYYLNPDDTVSYCWHPRLQVAVGFDHHCRWWAPIPGQA